MSSNHIAHRYAEVNGVRLHYAAAGHGKLMLFIHGWPEFWYAWKEQLAEFSRDHFVVAPDTRGVNLSSKPQDVSAYHARELVEDMRQLIEQLGHGKAIVVAHDWGGAIAWNLAAQHPEMVEKLVILNSPHPMPYMRELARNPAQQAASAYMLLLADAKAERVLMQDDYRRLRAQLDGWKKSARPPTQEDLDLYMQAWTQPGALTAGLNYYRASPLRPPSETSANAAGLKLDGAQFTVRVPTLVIWGMQDSALTPALLDGLEQWVPDLRIERIEQATHWVAHEFPERVNALIRGFVT
ncbi:MAG TPA: alpha/beta hydrolase [Nevskiaceae bacterium]|nr:alpha/beta hydrolase [Nevskiaceae bacterium]